LAPEHVAENLLLEEKAKADPSKKRKLVRRKPPTKGYVHWDRGTFAKLVGGTPEPLVSRFQVSHAMLVHVLSREQGGCAAMKQIIQSCHDRPAQQRLHGRMAIQMLRSLLRARVVEMLPGYNGHGPKFSISEDLQRGFSLNHTLSLYLVDTIRLLDPERDCYCLDVLSLVEAILEDPSYILDRQLDRIKRAKLAELKADGVEYEQRMEELDKLEYPRPNSDFIYGTFNAFSAKHPWIALEHIRPKGVARELYEQYLGFNEAVTEYELDRSEGLLLRYLSDVYKTLVQNVPESAWTEEVDDMIAYFHGIVRGVDSSLIDEWEKLRDPSYLPEPTKAEPPPIARERPIIEDLRAFTVLVRNRVFALVRALAKRDYAAAPAFVEAPPDTPGWTAERFEAALAPFYEDHSAICFDPRSRGTEHTLVDRSHPRRWDIKQKLVDPEEHNDWVLDVSVDLERSVAADEPVLVLRYIGP